MRDWWTAREKQTIQFSKCAQSGCSEIDVNSLEILKKKKKRDERNEQKSKANFSRQSNLSTHHIIVNKSNELERFTKTKTKFAF